MMPAVRVLILAVALPLLAASAAQAQGHEPSDAALAEARALFMAGQAAVDAGRWADAVTNFSRAYELSRVPAALYNLGFALRALGRHREARDAFTRLLERHARMDRQLRQDSRAYRDEEAGRVAVIQLTGLDPDSHYDIRFDGARFEDGGDRPFRLESDAGSHTLTARAPGIRPFVWEGVLSDGQRLTIEVALVPEGGATPSGPIGPGPTPPPNDSGGGLLSSPWFWLGVGVVVLGAGAGLGYFFYQDAQLDPQSDRVYEL